MKDMTSKLVLLTISAVVLLLLPCATAARDLKTRPIDAGKRQRLDLPDALLGPESVAFDSHGGGPYVSVSDGRVLRYAGEGAGWKTFAYSPSYGGKAKVLVTEADGVPLLFTNGVDVDLVIGDVCFTDSSAICTRAQHQMVTATGDSTGRLLKYDPKANRVTVLHSNLAYPNGVAISADQTHLIVALTGPCRLLKYWIQGPKAGSSEAFADLPGYPDNVRSDGKRGY
ncbi:hypothetical protein ACP70R_015693 [Stipagrostis hirtigluma subsp. patula]